VERQHGSSEETRTQSRRKEGRSNTRPQQGRPQRFGAEGSSHTRAEQGGESGGAEEAPVARFDPNQTEKPAKSPAFLLS
jgi:hypothetical protein